MELKNVRRGRIREYAEKFPGVTHHDSDLGADHNPLWAIPAACAFPSATENEVSAKDAATLLENGCFVVSEGANMPSVPDAVDQFVAAGILYGPGKAANAGGVAVSGLEMAQNVGMIQWKREVVDHRLSDIMFEVHDACVKASERFDAVGNYVVGANIAGFFKVADAMMDQGVV